MKLSRLKPICGIYKITNTQNGRVYVGQSANIMVRWANHVEALMSGKHSNLLMLDDYRQMGLVAFNAEVVERCNKELLLNREQFYIAYYYQAGVDLYNKIDNGIRMVQVETVKQWRVGWRPIDRATMKPVYSDVPFETFLEASRAAAMLNSSDRANHYFVDQVSV